MRDIQSITLRELLPPSIYEDPNILAAAEAIDEQLYKAAANIPGVSIIPRIREITDYTIIDLLAWQFHVDSYDPGLPLDVKRELVAKSLDWHTRKGTVAVVEEVSSAVFGNSKISEWFEYGGDPYLFRISVDVAGKPVTPDDLDDIRRVVYAYKNVRSHLDGIIINTAMDAPLRIAGAVFGGISVTELPPLVWDQDYEQEIRMVPRAETVTQTTLPQIGKGG